MPGKSNNPNKEPWNDDDKYDDWEREQLWNAEQQRLSKQQSKRKKKTAVSRPLASSEQRKRASAAGVSGRKMSKYKNDPAGLEQEIQRVLDADIARIKSGGNKKK